MSIPYHGNWCGPGWSNGSRQPSVRGTAPAIDEFDQTCRDHDFTYADGMGDNDADDVFFNANIGRGLKRSVAALLVKSNRLVRPSTIKQDSKQIEMSRMRGAKVLPVRSMPVPVPTKQSRIPAPRAGTNRREPQRSAAGLRVTAAPVSLGTTIVATRPRQSRTSRGCRIQGREFMASVYEYNNSNWQLSALCPLHPAYFVNSTIGNVCRGFSRFRWNGLTVHFVSRQPTSVTGEIALTYSANNCLPAENGAGGGFLPRVMSRGNAILGPLWLGHSIVIPCDQVVRDVDAFASIDFNLNVMGEVQAYTLSGVTDTAGYLLFEYDIEFMDVMYQPHSTIIPVPTGTGAQYTLTDTSATPTAANAVQFSNATLAAAANGTVYRCVLDLDQSTLATGTTAANAWQSNTAYASSLTAITSTGTAQTLVDGLQLYVAVVGTSLYAYTSYESAVNGDSTGQIFYKTTGSSAASIVVIAYFVRMGSALLALAS
jgi:hypothetical protein